MSFLLDDQICTVDTTWNLQQVIATHLRCLLANEQKPRETALRVGDGYAVDAAEIYDTAFGNRFTHCTIASQRLRENANRPLPTAGEQGKR